MFKNILLAADGSDHSIRAAEKAVELAKLSQKSLVEIVYVVSGESSKSEVINNWNELDVKVKREEKLDLIKEKAKKASVPYKITFLHGDPGPTIVKHANDHNFDVLVIGSRGLNTFQEMVLGSVSHKVAKRVNCPVMIVK